jgi:hypothetical protein
MLIMPRMAPVAGLVGIARHGTQVGHGMEGAVEVAGAIHQQQGLGRIVHGPPPARAPLQSSLAPGDRGLAAHGVPRCPSGLFFKENGPFPSVKWSLAAIFS